jgi:formate hydrogenlyase subunit 6/NADH:ubiquinone oxidoreductase subunit I
MKRREEMTFLERMYVLEVARGVTLTFGKLGANFLCHFFSVVGLPGLGNALSRPIKALCGISDAVGKHPGTGLATIQYPNERRPYPARFRGRHRLTLYSDGDIKCTSCFLCATACPAKCIYIEAAEHDDPEIEKFPHRYEIDTLLCIYCGYCVEACPVDAIRMDTGLHPEVYQPDPRLFIEDKEVLMQRSRDLEDLGADELFEKHMKKMQEVEKNPASVLLNLQ